MLTLRRAIGAVLACVLLPLGAMAAIDPQVEAVADAIRLRNLATAMHTYNGDNKSLPPDLGSMFPYVIGVNETDIGKAISERMMAPGVAGPKVPDDVNAAWINANSTYTYIGRAGISLEEMPEWSEIAIAHLNLKQGHSYSTNPTKPEEQMFTVAYLDGHVELMPRAEAQRVIDLSKQTFEAISAGTELPERFQQVADMELIVGAIHAYATAHNDDMPPDLGETLPYVMVGKRTPTPAKRAAIFLSSSARKNTHIPEAPTPDWVRRNTTYLYLGGPGLKLAKVEDAPRTILICVKPDGAIELVQRDATKVKLFTLATLRGNVSKQPLAYYEWAIPQSRKVFESARSGTPLPDLQHALRDLRIINKAFTAYAAAHEGMLPPDLGATFEYLPADELPNATPRQKAAVFLTPKAERISQPPESADAAWVTAHANYKYLAGAGVPLKPLREGSSAVLLRAPTDEGLSMMVWDKPQEVVPTINAQGWLMPSYLEWIEQSDAESLSEIKAANEAARK